MPKFSLKKFNPAARISGKELLGIDLSGPTLKIVHLRVSPARAEVINFFSRSILGLSEDDAARVVRSALAEMNVRNAEVIDVIPTHLVISKNIEIPSINMQEIKEIINLQAGRHTPYSREEIIVDYVDIGTYKRSYTKILLIILARQVIKKQFEIFKRAGLKPEKVFLSAEGISRCASQILKLDTDSAPVAIIHIDDAVSDFTVVYKSKAIFLRSIPIGASNLSEERQIFQARFAEEIKRSLESYQSEDIEGNVVSAVLTGAIDDLRDITMAVSDALHIPAKAVSYAHNVIIPNEAFNRMAAVKGVSFFGVSAGLLVYQQMKIDLVPEEIKLKKALEERGKQLIRTGIYVLSIFVVVFLILVSQIYFGTAYLNKLQKKYQPLSAEVEKLEGDYSKTSRVKNYLSMRGYSLEVLSELYNLVNEGLLLNDIRYDDQQQKFSIRGTAESMSLVFSFVERMEKSKYFSDVKTKYTTKRKEGSKDVTDFEIAASLDRGSDRL